MWNSRSKRKSFQYGDESQPAWNKEEQHAKMEHMRQQIEEGQLDGTPRLPSWPFTILGVLLIITAFGLLIFGVFEIRRLQSGGEWPTITARVTSTSVYSYWDDKQKKTDYGINLIYTYTVKGRNYTNTDTEDSYGYKELAEKHRGDFMGRTKTLWYNPDSPDQNAFFPVVAVLSVASIVGAAVALIVGIFFFMEGDPRPQKPALESA